MTLCTSCDCRTPDHSDSVTWESSSEHWIDYPVLSTAQSMLSSSFSGIMKLAVTLWTGGGAIFPTFGWKSVLQGAWGR